MVMLLKMTDFMMTIKAADFWLAEIQDIAVAKVVKTLYISVRVGGLCNMSGDFNRCAV